LVQKRHPSGGTASFFNFHGFRNSSGSLAILAAIRRAEAAAGLAAFNIL